MGIAKPDCYKKLRDNIYTKAEVQQMMDYEGTKSITAIRNRTVISVLYRTQVRISELCSLRLQDLNMDEAHLYVAFGKGDEARLVGIPMTGLAHLEMWLKVRKTNEHIINSGSQWLFCAIRRPHTGNRMNERKIRKTIRRIGEKSGVEKRVHPHGFRHSGTHHLIQCNVDLQTIRQQLGHKRLDSTFRYCEGLNPQYLKTIKMKAKF